VSKVCVGCSNYTLRMLNKCKKNLFLEKELCPVYRRRKFLDMFETVLVIRDEQASVVTVAGGNKEPSYVIHENTDLGSFEDEEYRMSLFALVVVAERESAWKPNSVKGAKGTP